jgi:hypothetical protein
VRGNGGKGVRIDEFTTPQIDAFCPRLISQVGAGVQTLFNRANPPGRKSAQAEQFVDNSVAAELETSSFIVRLYKQ